MYPSSRELPSFDPVPMSYDEMLFGLTEEDYKAEINFIGSDPLTIKTANAQEFYNYYQLYPKVIMFDMRSRTNYANCQLKWSINLPVDVFKSEDFINFNPNKIMDEHLTLDWEKEMFKNRKRSIIFIVSHRVWTTHIFEYLHKLFDPEKVSSVRFKFSAEDILATKNCLLLYLALK